LIHASSVEWIKQWADSMKTSGDVEPSGIKVYNDVTLNFDGVTSPKTKKNPDAGIYPRGRTWPTIALEAGYPEDHDGLKGNTELLLRGSYLSRLRRLAR